MNLLKKCFHDDSTYVCPLQVLALVNTTNWLGMPWTPMTNLPFRRTHIKAKDCSDFHDLYHLGGRYYLSTSTRSLTITQKQNTTTMHLSPLMIYHFPCDVKFSDQSTGLGDCPQRLTINIPIFTATTFRYVPWHDAMDKSIPTLHYESLNIPPSTKFNKTTLDALDATFHSLDQSLGKDLTKLKSDVNLIQETYVTSINDVFTYVALCLSLMNLFALLLAIGCPRCHHLSCTARRKPNEVISESADIRLENFPTCEDCSRPHCPST